MSGVVPLAEAHDESLFGAKAVGLGEAARAGLPIPPGVALSGAVVDAVAGGERQRDRRRSRSSSGRCGGPLAVRSSAVDEDGADASFAGQHLTLLNVPVGRRGGARGARDLVVGELRLGDHLPPARRPLHAAERRRRRPVAARSRTRRRDVHAEPDQRRRRAGDRGELGARRGGRRRPRDPRPLPHRPRPARCSSARRDSRRSRSGRSPTAARSRSRSRRAASSSSASTTTSSRSCTGSPAAARRSTAPAATSSGRSPAGSSTCCSAGRSRGSAASDAQSPGAAGRRRCSSVAALRRARPRGGRGRSPRLFKERRFAAGETVTKEGSGGAAFFVIESGEATVTIGGEQRATLRAGRLLRRDRAHRRGRAHRRRSPPTTELVCYGLTSGSSARSCRRTARSAGSCCRRWPRTCARPSR